MDTQGHCAGCGRYLPDELRPAPVGGALVCEMCGSVAEYMVDARKAGVTDLEAMRKVDRRAT